MSLIKSFTAKAIDQCCKCGAQIEIGDQISWLRDDRIDNDEWQTSGGSKTLRRLTLTLIHSKVK